MKKNLLDFRTASKEEIFENFSLSNLDTMKDSERFNVNTRSTLRSPRVSMYKDPSLLDRFDDFRGKSIEVNNKAMHLNALVKEANRNYECVQIGEVDNVLPRQNSVNLTSSLYNDSKEGKEGREESRRRLSQKDLNSLALIAQKKSFKNVKFGNADLNIMEYNSNLNDASIKEIEMLGYERDYIVRCLRNNDLNYCTAFYYLLSKKSE